MKTFETEKGNIPEGATHYSNEAEGKYFCWYSISEVAKICVLDGVGFGHKWHKCTNEHKGSDVKPIPSIQTETPEEKEALDAIEQVEWNGEGLPPVGAECEFEYPSGRWNKGYYHGETSSGAIKMHILEYEGGDIETLGGLTKFRKPETPEAKKEREELEAAYDLYCHVSVSANRGTYTIEQFCDESLTDYKIDYLAIVRKTGYRKGE